MYLLNAGVVAKLLSPTVVHGFTFGVALQVFTSQFSTALGISIPRSALTSNHGVTIQVLDIYFSIISIRDISIYLRISNKQIYLH